MNRRLARASLTLSLLLPVYFMAAALGTKFGVWPWQVGLMTMVVQLGVPLLGLSILLGLVALVVVLIRKPRQGLAMALTGLLIPVFAVGYVASVRARAGDVPPIHDISTDISDPPVFSASVLATRQSVGANPVDSLTAPMSSLKVYQAPAFAKLAEKTLGQVGHDAYPAVRTLTLAMPPAKVLAAAEVEARAEGWKVLTTAPAAGTLEATAETFWFGFKDDVTVRIRPTAAGGSVVDVRSTSRVGLSDVGTNAARIKGFLMGLKTRLEDS